MRKARKKAVSIIVALTFLLGLVFAYAGPAVAENEWTKVTAGFKFISTGENQPAGTITVAAKANWSDADVDVGYITLTLPTGVTYKKAATASETTSINLTTSAYVYSQSGSLVDNVYIQASSPSMLRLKVMQPLTTETIQFLFNKDTDSALKVDLSVTGDIKATVEVMGVNSSTKDVKFVETSVVLGVKG
ncbi:MAG: hypothetical protein ACUVTQ_08595 [Desulfotomaculales bacterium]